MRRQPAFLIASMLLSSFASAQFDIENVIVETYYISDANDATDEIGGTLAIGSKTYRVFLDLCDSCALRAIYGDANHVLSISSTAPFFNHHDRGKVYGHEINNSALDEGTAALDSWLSMGAASSQKFGVLKSEDADGSIVGGSNNDGGSAELPQGLLANADPGAGIPITEQDGLVPLDGGAAVPPSFIVFGNSPDGAFADSTLSGIFQSDSTRINCSIPGVKGPTPTNRILIAQLTTTGELSFCINVEIEKPDGSVIKYVSDDTVLLPDETASGLLCYPPQCGCTDPNFLEYDPSAGCDDGSCQTAIIFGCLDTLACNYDPDANFHVQQLCCYGPLDCNGLDVDIVCPGVGMNEITNGDPVLEVFPNPVRDDMTIRVNGTWNGPTHVTLHDMFGRVAIDEGFGEIPAGRTFQFDASGLAAGVYLLRLRIDGTMNCVRIVID